LRTSQTDVIGQRRRTVGSFMSSMPSSAGDAAYRAARPTMTAVVC